MASLYGRVILQSSRLPMSYTTIRAKTDLATKFRNFMNRKIPDYVTHSTGMLKDEIVSILSGNDDPFTMKALKRGPGTKDCPNLVPSAFESRIIGCICEEESTHVNWMWLHKGQPRRCECGHWFKLVDRPDGQVGHEH